MWKSHQSSGIGGKSLEARVLLATMLRDATELVRKCKIFLEHAKISHLPSEPLTPVTSPWPFQKWGLDILGPLPIGRGQCKFIVVAVDYFTKWAEAEPLATITKQKVRNFVWRSIVCRFGIPRALVSDNGKQFNNPKFRDFCPSSKSGTTTRPQLIHNSMDKQKSPSEPLKQH